MCDLVNDIIPFEPNKAEFSIILFVMSAISPENYLNVAKKIYE